MSAAADRALRQAFGDDRVLRDAPLAPFTTFKVGGPADWLVQVGNARELCLALDLARANALPVTVIGGGSNILVADVGIRGLVLRLHGGEVTKLTEDRVRADSGVTINGLVRWTISRGLAGLEAWAGTPGTVGGAVFGNAHFHGRLIGELIAAVSLVTRNGRLVEVPSAEMEFAYDYSRVHRTNEIVLSADFRVTTGDPAALRAVARESLAFRKHTQPLESASAGCIFRNPDPARDAVPAGLPPSAGALVDGAGLKGARERQAMVSLRHANFIVNHGGATAEDIRALIERCKREVQSRFGVQLLEEIVYVGFDEPEAAAE